MNRIPPGSMGRARVIQGHFAAGLPRLGSVAQPYALGRAVPLPDHLQGFGQGLPGNPLPEPVRRGMEDFFGASFSDVRVHVGQDATRIGALAFTTGSSIFFAAGHYDPLSQRGRHLLGHELAHVVQQRQGRVRNPFGSGVALVQDPMLEAEAERLGMRAALQLSTAPRTLAVQPCAPSRVPVPRPTVRHHPPRAIQRMIEETGNNQFNSNENVSNFNTEDQDLWNLAIAAYNHMRSLVIKNDKDSAKLKIHKLDIEATKTYRTYDDTSFHSSQSTKTVGAVATVEGVNYYATNSHVPNSMKARLKVKKEKYDKKFKYVDETVNQENTCYVHAEMKLFSRFGSQVGYIGVSKLCCLYCAAQMLAMGFTGFRGCHMKAFNNYQWHSYACDPGEVGDWYRARVWGDEVAYWVKKMSNEQWDSFIRKVSQGSTLAQKAIGINKKYSNVNQIPLQVYDDDSDDDRPDYVKKLQYL